MPLAPGTSVGRYGIRSLLGQGGMGEVYRAADTSLGRDVALKVLGGAVAADPERVHRFLQEARAASALNHPNIIARPLAGNVQAGGQVLLLSAAVAAGVVASLLVIYGRFGLGAVFVAVVCWPILQQWPAARALGGPEAGPRGTIILAVVLILAAVAIWSYAGARMKAGVDTLSSKSGIR